jgi:hypothetical protein
MKHLIISLITITIGVVCAQEKKDAATFGMPQQPGLRPTAESLMKASEKQSPTPPRKSEAAPPATPQIEESKLIGDSFAVIEGAVYIRAGDTIIPMPGGGASGCFMVNEEEARAKIERARAAFAGRIRN